MLSEEEFRTGSFSLSSTEADEVPPHLAYKEFSMNEAEGLYYYYCAYHTPARLHLETPPCLAGQSPAQI